MKIIPLTAVASQTLTIVLNSQTCQINVYEKSGAIYIDLYVNNVLLIGGVIGENKNRIVRSAYLGFVGDLSFWDTQGDDDPQYTGLGARWQLLYLEDSADVTLGGIS